DGGTAHPCGGLPDVPAGHRFQRGSSLGRRRPFGRSFVRGPVGTRRRGRARATADRRGPGRCQAAPARPGFGRVAEHPPLPVRVPRLLWIALRGRTADHRARRTVLAVVGLRGGHVRPGRPADSGLWASERTGVENRGGARRGTVLGARSPSRAGSVIFVSRPPWLG